MQDQTVYKIGNALIPTDFVICSLELRPFSLGAYTLLEYLGSPFVSSEAKDMDYRMGLSHFLINLIICSQSYEDNIKMLNDEKILNETVKEVEKHIKKTMKKDKRWNLFEKFRLFREYIQYYMDVPLYTEEKKNDSTPSGMDWKQSMFTLFKNELNYSELDILNMSMRKMFSEWCSYAEKNGAIKVVNKNDYDQIQRITKGKVLSVITQTVDK